MTGVLFPPESVESKLSTCSTTLILENGLSDWDWCDIARRRGKSFGESLGPESTQIQWLEENWGVMGPIEYTGDKGLGGLPS